jgi:uncharacterized protein YjiS (DUF1127 family)
MKIFRKVRQKLASENKVAAYLRYAVGEILLLVIGILIALQVNNWNEQRKSKQELNQLKISLISDLTKDTVSISNELKNLIADNAKISSYYKRMGSPYVTRDTLIQIYQEFYPSIYGDISFNNNALNSLRSTGYFSSLENWLQKDLIEISELKENYGPIRSDIANYVDVLTLDAHHYPLTLDTNHPQYSGITSLKPDSKLIKEIWKHANFVELGSYMNALFEAKSVVQQECIIQLMKIQKHIVATLQKLNSEKH